MFEFTISIKLDKQSYISKLYSDLHEEILSMGGIAIKENYQGRCYFSFAIKHENKEYFKSKIINYIIYIIVNEYKYEFFQDNLDYYHNNNVIFQSFLKAVCIFDEDVDREIILKQVDFNGDLLIDSFYYFKLKELRSRWQKTINIIKINQITSNENSMIDVMKYLVSMSECMVEKAEILISNKLLKIKQHNQTQEFKNNDYGLSDFLSTIIELNPAKINLKVVNNKNLDLIDVLNRIFYDKIYF